MAKWDDIHWVKTSADIPRNDFLNYTPEELARKYPKLRVEEIRLQRHMFFPKRFSLPAGMSDADMRFRRNVVINSLSDLRDSIFGELTPKEIQSQHPRFALEEIIREKTMREIRILMKNIRANLMRPSPETKERVVADIQNAKLKLAGVRPQDEETSKAQELLVEIEGNIKAG
jgi:hypothetical protein